MFDWFLGLLTPAQWDAWRGWLTTSGGLLALVIATSTYRRNGKIRREEQARLIYSKFTHVEHHEPGTLFSLLPNEARVGNGSPGMLIVANDEPDAAQKSLGLAIAPLIQTTVLIHNGSKELIGPARVQMVNGGNGRVWDDFSISTSSVEPETDYIVNFTWVNEFHPGQPSLATTLIFRDASGQWWRRHSAEPIEMVHADPENEGPTARERVVIRDQQEAMGVEEDLWLKEPTLTWRVRWFRSRRRSAGKTPTP